MELCLCVYVGLLGHGCGLTRKQRVHCQHGHAVDRDGFQDMLSESNPEWKEFADELERTGRKPRTNPDGDVGAQVLGIPSLVTDVIPKVVLEGVAYDEFVVPNCRECLVEGRINSVVRKLGIAIIFAHSNFAQLKPDVVFFGESIHDSAKDSS